MTKQTSDLPGGRVSQNEGPTLRVFVAFEDLKTRVAAWQLYRHVAEDLARDLELTSAFCNIEGFNCGDQLEATTLAASEADLVLFSISATFEITPELKSWFELWVPRRRVEDGGLFLVFEHSVEPQLGLTATQSFFRDAAKRAGMEFLIQTIPSPAEPTVVATNQTPNWKPGEPPWSARRSSELTIERVS